MTEPVGPEYGLKPTRTGPPPRIPPDSEDLVSDHHYSTGSEFGGVPGLIQPPPHKPTASERRMMVMAIDPTDSGVEPESVAPPELEGF
jgi:hypothetical protein